MWSRGDHWVAASRAFDKAYDNIQAKQAARLQNIRLYNVEPLAPPPPPDWEGENARKKHLVKARKALAATQLGIQGLLGYGIYKLIDKIKSKKGKKDNTNGSGEQRRPTRRRAFKKGGVVKRKVVRKRAHKKAGKR